MSTDALIAALSALGGVLVGSVAEAIRSRGQFKRDKWWALYEDRRGRIEQIYVAVEEQREAYRSLLAGVVTSLNTGNVAKWEMQKIPWARLDMLIGLYAPELETELKSIREMANALGRIVADVIGGLPGSNSWRNNIRDQFLTAFSAHDAGYVALIEKLKGRASELSETAGKLADLK